MTTIALDSSTTVCSAALVHDGQVTAERLNLSDSNHASLLPTYVQELQSEAEQRNLKVEGIVLSEGPGSYTGLRIGASLAKGLCYGAAIPLLTVPTLAVIAASGLKAVGCEQEALICPMIDARRMEVYCALYDAELRTRQALAPMIIDEQSFANVLDDQIIYFCGNGAGKCRQVIRHPNARWIDGIVPTGAQAAVLAERYADREDLVRVVSGKNLAYFEPNYLKEFIAAPSHIKGLH